MPRIVAFEDNQVGRSQNEVFQVTGTEKRPQRIALIPGEAFNHELTITDALRMKASAGDKEAQNAVESIQALQEVINSGLRKKPPSAEMWETEDGKKCILYSKMTGEMTFFAEGLNYVIYKEGIPDSIIASLKYPPSMVYGFVVLEYELDDENGVKILPPDRQIDLGGGHKLDFKYQLRPWTLRDSHLKTWKTHYRNNPLIFSDFEVWNYKQGDSTRMNFSPSGFATWRGTPNSPNIPLMRRIIKEARSIHANMSARIAREFTVEEIIKAFPNVAGVSAMNSISSKSNNSMPMENVDFSVLLGANLPSTEPDPATSQPSPEATPESADIMVS
jgi:hypothetical protein